MFPPNSKNRKSEATSRKTLRTKTAPEPDGDEGMPKQFGLPVDSPTKPAFGKKPSSKRFPKR